MDHVSLATSNREKRRALRLRSSTTDINRDVVEQRSQRPLNGESSTPVIKPTHSRNQSQDSTHSLESEQVHHERSTDRYFQRISLVIGKKSSSFDHTLVVESGRGVLYSFTQLYKVIRNSILCTGEDQLSAQFAPVLSECNLGMQKLMASLESADAVLMAGKALDPWLASELLQNSISAISQFHRLVSVVRLRIGGILAALDARLGRHLILNLHGVIAEMATAWHSLMSLENHSSSLGSMSTCSFESPQSPLAATVSETTGIPPLKITPIPYISRPNTPTAHKANRARSQSDNVHLSPSSPWPATPTVPLPIGRSADVDAQLYTSLQTAAQTGIFALGKLLDTFEEFLDKLGPEQSDPLLPQQPGLEGDFVRPGVGGLDRKLRDVIRQLHVALDITKRWQKSVLLVSKNEEGGNTASISLAVRNPTRARMFWEETMAYLKASRRGSSPLLLF
ncbi:hypothetical protein BZG36_02022 [Bifiguratus adelaidae]|uniref:Uncharacterized protein n=1 Tax=Bifiguratus adelaidae TaxID=1938954 RepID=A0A261Y1Y4_9FUNG|nr:hypothetical protein BZG36_02022 [Bifiguratus adelaidae]